MDKTVEDYQEDIDLTPEQQKAFEALKRAVARCRKEKVYFYQNLHTLFGLNGKNVKSIGDDSNFPSRPIDHPSSLQYLSMPSVTTTDSWADDTHFVVLKGEK